MDRVEIKKKNLCRETHATCSGGEVELCYDFPMCNDTEFISCSDLMKLKS